MLIRNDVLFFFVGCRRLIIARGRGPRSNLFRLSSDKLRLKSFPRSQDAVVVQFLELLHQGVSLHDQVQGRGLYAPDRNHLASSGRERVGTGGVQADHPVGTLPKSRRIAQVHALRGVFQIFPSLVQVLCYVAVHPQALDCLLS